MATVSVHPGDDGAFRVEVDDRGRRTSHTVRVSPDEAERYGAGATDAALVEASFQFLLEREPPSSIMREFDIAIIERYFPEYPAEIRRRLADG